MSVCMTQVSQATSPDNTAWVRVRALADRRVLLMLALGFSSGLPLLLVLGTFSARLAFSDVDVKTIGLFSYLALPYSLKFLWAPVVDKLDPPVLTPWLGRRRAWMVLSQLCVAAALMLMAFADPGQHTAFVGLGAFLVAFSTATQDVVIDGWRIDAAGTEMQGVMAATSNLGYRLALITAGAGALVLAHWAGWTAAYLAMAALMSIGILAALAAPVIERKAPSGDAEKPTAAAPAAGWSRGRALLDPIADLHRRLGPRLWAILIMVALYRMPDFVSGVMANPLYKTVGYSLPEIAAVTKLYGVWVGIFASFVAGWAIARLGLYPTFVVGGVLAAASNLSFSWLSFGSPEVWRLTVAISVDNFAGGFAGTALIAYMSGLTGTGFAASQYALLSSLYAFPGKLAAGSTGFVVAAYGFPVFFALTAAIGVPVVLLSLALRPKTAQIKEEPPAEEAAAGEPSPA